MTRFPGLARDGRTASGSSFPLLPSSIRRLAIGVLLGFLGLAGCQSGGAIDEPGREVHGDPLRLLRRQPADIAVAPVRDQTGNDDVPRDLFREAFLETMVEKLYSPLDPGYVDANWIEASFRGTPQPDGLLMVVIDAWDPSRLYSAGIVEIGGEVVLFEGGNTTGAILWARTLREEIRLSGPGGPPGPSKTHIPTAIRRFATKAMAALPDRDPLAAHHADEMDKVVKQALQATPREAGADGYR